MRKVTDGLVVADNRFVPNNPATSMGSDVAAADGYMLAQNSPAAVDAYGQQKFVVNPEYANAFFKQGIRWYKKGDIDQAIENFSSAISNNPNFVNAYCYRGAMWGYKGDFEKVIMDFTKAIEIDPNNMMAYFNRGDAYQRMHACPVRFTKAVGAESQVGGGLSVEVAREAA